MCENGMALEFVKEQDEEICLVEVKESREVRNITNKSNYYQTKFGYKNKLVKSMFTNNILNRSLERI
ncbi:MAG: hypothetical protein ACRCXT_21805 [Paraclostridium sp.]